MIRRIFGIALAIEERPREREDPASMRDSRLRDVVFIPIRDQLGMGQNQCLLE